MSRLNYSLLRDYVLGSTYVGPGLLKRVEQVVLAQDVIDGPRYRTGSVMPTGTSHGRDAGDESGLSERCFDLLIGLTQWRGSTLGFPRFGQGAQSLLRYLVKNRITDVHLLTQGGPAEEGEQPQRPILAEIRDEFDRLVPAERDGDMDPADPAWVKAEALITFLQDWLESDCDHDWERVSSADMQVSVLRCKHPRCGVQKHVLPDDEELVG